MQVTLAEQGHNIVVYIMCKTQLTVCNTFGIFIKFYRDVSLHKTSGSHTDVGSHLDVVNFRNCEKSNNFQIIQDVDNYYKFLSGVGCLIRNKPLHFGADPDPEIFNGFCHSQAARPKITIFNNVFMLQ